MLSSKLDHVFVKKIEFAILFKEIPVEPRNLIILTIRIVIAILRITEFISGIDHRGTAAAHKNSDGVSHHSESQSKNIRIVGITFIPAIPAPVIIGTVSIVPAVIFIMLVIICIKIVKCKSVMTVYKIDGRLISHVRFAIHIHGSRNSLNRLGRRPDITLKIRPYIISILAVPFRPAFPRREISHLVHSTRIPRFRNKLNISQNGIVSNSLNKRRSLHRCTILITPQDTCKIESESVHPVFFNPVP